MKVEIKDGHIIITAPIVKQVSKSGKSVLLASSNGNLKTSVMFEGKQVVLGLNCYISKD